MLNILLITLDQFRGDALSCASHPIVRTPNLDRLASEGVRFARVTVRPRHAVQAGRASTLIVATSDHGEQLGDHGLIQKFGFFEGSYHILGIARDPRPGKARGAVVEAFSENVDVFPTLCEAMGEPIPAQCDGLPLTPFLAGAAKPDWRRDVAHWEFDWRFSFIRGGPHDWPRDRRLERQNLVVHRSETAAYVHFGDGGALAFDLAADATWRTPSSKPSSAAGARRATLICTMWTA